MGHPVHLVIDGQPHDLTVDPRTTLLDALRDHLGNMSPKKGSPSPSPRAGRRASSPSGATVRGASDPCGSRVT